MSAVVVERLVGGIAPQLAAHELVEALGEGLGQPVGQRRQEDGRVVVVGGLERAPCASASPMPGRHREGAHVVGRRPTLERAR